MEYLTNLNMKAVFNVAQLCSQKMVKLKIEKKLVVQLYICLLN